MVALIFLVFLFALLFPSLLSFTHVLYAYLCFLFLRVVWNVWLSLRRSRNLRLVRAQKMLQQYSAVEQVLSLPSSPSEYSIPNTASEIVDAIRLGHLDAHDVMLSMCKRAASTRHLNCLTQVNFEEALQQSSLIPTHPSSVAPLHGLPVSVKDSYDVAGMDSSCGVLPQCHQPATKDAPIVTMLREAGAIIFTKTNLMQALCGSESDTPLWGPVKNPWNLARSAGGSSGGEAALIAAGGSLLGFGTDIGGSIRTPSHFCGVFGFKPTARRVSTRASGGSLHQEAVLNSIGPMARSMPDLLLGASVLLSPLQHQVDPEIPPLPFSMQTKPRSLRIGYYIDDGFLPSFAACSRAVIMAKEALEELGHELVPVQVPRPRDMMRLTLCLFGADGNAGLADCIFGTQSSQSRPLEVLRMLGLLDANTLPSDIDISLFKQILLASAPRWFRVCLGRLLETIGEQQAGYIFRTTGPVSVPEYMHLQQERTQYRDEFLNMWKSLSLDAIICPPCCTVAIPHGWQGDLTPLILSYTMLVAFVLILFCVSHSLVVII